MSDNTGILIVTEARDGKLAPVAAELFAAAQLIAPDSGETLSAVVIGSGAAAAGADAGKFGAGKVFVVETGNITADAAAINITRAISSLTPRFVLVAENDLGKDLAPMLAAALQTAAVTDVINISRDGSRAIYTRPVYGGNALADFTIETEPEIVSIRPKAFNPASPGEGTAEIIEMDSPESPSGIRVIERVAVAETGSKIEDSKIVIGGGRGMGGPEGFEHLKQMADILGASVGASRPPCDQDWWPDSGQIGITGKIIAPDLYIAVGISGSSQHLSGISGAKTIVAINKDPEANIFKSATYGIVGDWKKVLPAFTDKIRELTGK